jgi:hypothetical protein
MPTVIPIAGGAAQPSGADPQIEVRQTIITREKIAGARAAIKDEKAKLDVEAARSYAAEVAKADKLNVDDAVARFKTLGESRKKVDERDAALTEFETLVDDRLTDLKRHHKDAVRAVLDEQIAKLKVAIDTQVDSRSEIQKRLDALERERDGLQERPASPKGARKSAAKRAGQGAAKRARKRKAKGGRGGARKQP